MTSPSGTGARSRRVLVTHNTIAQEGIDLLNANDVDVFFSPPYTPSDEVAQKCKDLGVDAIMVRQGKINAEVIGASPKLKVIVKHGVGVDNVNIEAAAALGIPVLRSMGSNALAVAEHAIALAITLIKQLPTLDKSVKSGGWPKPTFIGRDIAGSTIGLIGYGSIGRHTARLAQALGMTVIVHDSFAEKAIADSGLTSLSNVDELVARADVVSLHCPLTHETRNIINAERLAMMKPHSVLVNTARGGLVDEQALYDALSSGQIAGAGLDSFAVEPPAPDSRLWTLDNLIATPHVAGVTHGSATAMATIAARHIISVLDGNVPDAASLALPENLSA